VLSTTRNQAGVRNIEMHFFEIWISSEIFEKCFQSLATAAIFSLDDRKQCAERVYALVPDIQPKACIV